MPYCLQYGTLENMSTRKPVRRTVRRAVGVVRISVQRDDETSTTTQNERITAWCAAQNVDLVEVVEAKGRSAYKTSCMSRDDIRRALQLIRTGTVDVLVCWKIDRVARNTKDLLTLIEEIEKAGGSFASVTEAFDTATPVGRMVGTVIGALAELESATKSERTDAWQTYRVDIGATPTGPRPYGYRRERNQLFVADDEAAVIHQMAAAVLGGATLGSIVAQLNADGLHTRAGKRFGRRAVKRILVGPTVAGLRATGTDTFTPSKVWEPILDRPTWEAVREVLLDPSRRTTPTTARRWLLSGLLTCGAHEQPAPMRMTTHANGPRYKCTADRCHRSVPAPEVDDLVERDLLGMLDVRSWRRLRRRGHHVDTAALEAELEELAEQRAEQEITVEEWRILREGLVRRLEEAAAEPMPLPDVDNIRKAWPAFTLAQRRLVVTAAVVSIVVGEGTGSRATCYDPQRGRHYTCFDEKRVVTTFVD